MTRLPARVERPYTGKRCPAERVSTVYYNVSQLLREPVGSTRNYEIDQQFALPYEGEPETRVIGPVTLIRTPRGILARATLAAEATEACSRCLRPAAVPLNLVVEEEFVPTIDPVTGARLPEPEDDAAFRIDAHHHLDLGEAVRQAAVLEEPMAPLCRPDCRGLCPQCGADLNESPCTCETGPIDERWSTLKHVLRPES